VDDALKSQLDETGGEKKQLAMEFVTLKTNYVEVNKQLRASQERVKQLGVELLSLANFKAVSGARVAELEKSQQRLEFEREKGEEQVQELMRELKELQGRVEQSDQQGGQHMHDKV
jgi:chromosome segregation ATPase